MNSHSSNPMRAWSEPALLAGKIGWPEKKPRFDAIPGARFLPSLCAGLSCYALCSVLVILGMALGHGLFPPSSPQPRPTRFYGCFANWDGQWYTAITRDGYFFDPHGLSSAGFFPAFPILGRLVMKVTGVHPEIALVIVSHLCFVGALVLLTLYVRRRYPSAGKDLPAFVLLAMVLCPTAFFFLMAYSESLFLFASILTFYLIERRAPPWLVAAVIGFTTAARIPGIGLLVPFAWYLKQQSTDRRDLIQKLFCWVPLACWGIGAYVLYSWLRFGEPLAFVRAQEMIHFRTAASWSDKLYCLAIGEPVRAVFDPSSPAYWKKHAIYKNPFFSLGAANPFYFAMSSLLVAFGAWRRWLSTEEWLFSMAILLIAYISRGYEMCMHSMGRYAAVAFPVYLVLGHLLWRCPRPLATGLLAVSGVFLTIYAAFFAAGHLFI